MKKYDLAIIGKRFPVGGVTVHVNRLLQSLEEKMMDYHFIKLDLVAMLKSLIVLNKFKAVHIHTSSPFIRVFFSIICRFCFSHSILTIHGNIGRFGPVKNFFDYMSMFIANTVIVLNQQSYKKAFKWNSRVFLVPAFIPPKKEKPLRKSVVKQLEKMKIEHRYLFSTCAWDFSFDRDGRELYGIIDLISIFGSSSKDCLIISDPSGKYKAYSQQKGIVPKNIFFITEEHSYFELLKYINVFIRSTTTDGDSLSVKEALFLKKNVIASNCVSRPENVILYESGDVKDLEQKIKQFDFNKNNQNSDVVNNGFDKLLDIYNLYI